MSNSQSAAVAGSSNQQIDSLPSPESYRPVMWEIVFSQDCNLRCRYCVTGYGRMGGTAKFMLPEVWKPLSERILQMSAGRKTVLLDFGIGETFLHFDEAMRFLDYLRERASGTEMKIEARITTNGTLVTRKQLQTCLEKNISLIFSIDGPAALHDRYRIAADGKTTHRRALGNFKLYRSMVTGVANGPSCTVSSVVAGDARLQDVSRFWRKLGVQQYKAIPVDRSRHVGCFPQQELMAIRNQYMDDLKQVAFAEAERLKGQELSQNYVGPMGILTSWMSMLKSSPCRSCGAGYSVMCVDANGALYPCQGFVGFPPYSIGSVSEGLIPEKLAHFRAARTQAEKACSSCWARFLCAVGCVAADPRKGIALDTETGCEIAKAHVEVAVNSFQMWSAHRKPNEEAKPQA